MENLDLIFKAKSQHPPKMASYNVIDYLADQVSPYCAVALFVLGFFSKSDLAIYLLFADFCFLFFITLAKGFLTMIRRNWLSIVWSFAKKYCTGAWLGMVLGITHIYRYWIGKFVMIAASGSAMFHFGI